MRVINSGSPLVFQLLGTDTWGLSRGPPAVKLFKIEISTQLSEELTTYNRYMTDVWSLRNTMHACTFSTGRPCSSCSALAVDVAVVSQRLSLLSILHSAVSSSVYKWPTKVHYMSYSSNYTHCSQLLLIHRMVAYSNHSPAENKMATRAMLIRDAFMLPMEPLTVRP